MKMNTRKSEFKKRIEEQWNQVKPPAPQFPKRVDDGHQQDYLPAISCAEKAIMAPVHPVVTVQKNFFACRRLRQEVITLIQDPDET
jgi:hypothetical protein